MKFRASFSVLNLWANGQWDEAIRAYFKLDRVITEAMKDGLKHHQEWEQEVIKSGKLPQVFGGKELTSPRTELKLVAQINDWLELVGVVDTLDEFTIYEYKTGVKSSSAYLKSMQMPLYALLCGYNAIKVNKGVLCHFNQHTGETDVSFVWLGEKKTDQAHEWLLTVASEMHNYLIENGLYDLHLTE